MNDEHFDLEREVVGEPVPRNVRIEKEDVEKYGYTIKCMGCKAILKGTRPLGHEACRWRLEMELAGYEKLKLENARVGKLCERDIEKADIEQKKAKMKKQLASGSGGLDPWCMTRQGCSRQVDLRWEMLTRRGNLNIFQKKMEDTKGDVSQTRRAKNEKSRRILPTSCQRRCWLLDWRSTRKQSWSRIYGSRKKSSLTKRLARFWIQNWWLQRDKRRSASCARSSCKKRCQ